MHRSAGIARSFFLVLLAAVLIAAIVSSLYLFQHPMTTGTSTTITSSSYSLPSGPYEPNVILMCPSGTYLADHWCVTNCPSGYQPTNMTNDLSVYSDSSPICLDNGSPLTPYDLAGLQISDDNGSSVFLVISDVPMLKMNITGQNYTTNIWLPISKEAFENLSTVSSPPNETTVVGTAGDTIGTFKILEINQTAVLGNVTTEYPVCCKYSTRTIHVGDDVGLACQGISEILRVIDYGQNVAVFTKNVSSPPPGGCPIWTESTATG